MSKILHKRPKVFRRDPIAYLWVTSDIPAPVYHNPAASHDWLALWLKFSHNVGYLADIHWWFVGNHPDELAEEAAECIYEVANEVGVTLPEVLDPGWLSRQRRGARQARREMERLSPK